MDDKAEEYEEEMNPVLNPLRHSKKPSNGIETEARDGEGGDETGEPLQNKKERINILKKLKNDIDENKKKAEVPERSSEAASLPLPVKRMSDKESIMQRLIGAKKKKMEIKDSYQVGSNQEEEPKGAIEVPQEEKKAVEVSNEKLEKLKHLFAMKREKKDDEDVNKPEKEAEEESEDKQEEDEDEEMNERERIKQKLLKLALEKKQLKEQANLSLSCLNKKNSKKVESKDKEKEGQYGRDSELPKAKEEDEVKAKEKQDKKALLAKLLKKQEEKQLESKKDDLLDLSPNSEVVVEQKKEERPEVNKTSELRNIIELMKSKKKEQEQRREEVNEEDDEDNRKSIENDKREKEERAAHLLRIQQLKADEEKVKKRERQEEERLERERQEKERLEKEREKIEKERQEKERLERERLEKETLERLERERLEKERLDRDRLEKERKEKERLERFERERLEKERLEKERLEKERLEGLKKERLKRLETERLERERLEKETRDQEEREREDSKQKKLLQEKRERERQERELKEQQLQEELKQRELQRLKQLEDERELIRQNEIKHQKELQRLKELEHQREIERQNELKRYQDLEYQKELEFQRQLEKETQRQKEQQRQLSITQKTKSVIDNTSYLEEDNQPKGPSNQCHSSKLIYNPKKPGIRGKSVEKVQDISIITHNKSNLNAGAYGFASPYINDSPNESDKPCSTMGNNTIYSSSINLHSNYSSFENQDPVYSKASIYNRSPKRYTNATTASIASNPKPILSKSPTASYVSAQYTPPTPYTPQPSLLPKRDESELSINLEDLLMLEEKLTDIIISLNLNKQMRNECFEWWNFFFNCSLFNRLEKTFKEEQARKIIQESNNISLLSIIICYDFSFEKTSLTQRYVMLKSILNLNHRNFMVICEHILSKISKDSLNNLWVFKLKNVINSNTNKHPEENFKNFIEAKSEGSKHIDEIKYNSGCISDYLRIILKSYESSKVTEYLVFLYKNIQKKSYEEINQFFREKIMRVENRNASVLASVLIRDNFKFLSVPTPYLKKPNLKKLTLVLDLDETLIHFKVNSDDESHGVLLERPGIVDFLETLGTMYELIIFTAAIQDYADPIINAIEEKRIYFDYRLYRQHAVIIDNDFVKDLTRLGRPIDKMIIVDNMPQNFRLQKENGIFIRAFWGEDHYDTALIDLLPILMNIAHEGGDVRHGLSKYREEIVHKVSSNISKNKK